MWRTLRSTRDELHLRLMLARLCVAPLPPQVGVRLRTAALRQAGFRIGKGTAFLGMPEITGPGAIYDRLVIGRDVLINVRCLLDLGAAITIGNAVMIGQEVILLTTSHKVGTPGCRAGDNYVKPLNIGDGAWLGARCIVLPGVTIGPGAVVAAGAVVVRDVAAHTMVGGVPARVIRELDPGIRG